MLGWNKENMSTKEQIDFYWWRHVCLAQTQPLSTLICIKIITGVNFPKTLSMKNTGMKSRCLLPGKYDPHICSPDGTKRQWGVDWIILESESEALVLGGGREGTSHVVSAVAISGRQPVLTQPTTSICSLSRCFGSWAPRGVSATLNPGPTTAPQPAATPLSSCAGVDIRGLGVKLFQTSPHTPVSSCLPSSVIWADLLFHIRLPSLTCSSTRWPISSD